MQAVNPDGKRQYNMDGFLIKILDRWVPLVKEKDWDFMGIIDGLEGSGKSLLSAQCAKYVDPTFDHTRMCFTAEEFNDAVRSAPKYSAVVWDEALLGGKGEDWAGTVAKTVRKTMGQVRQRNLFMFLNIPSFFELHKNYAVHRSRILIHVYTKSFERGYWAAWDDLRKGTLYEMGRKMMNHFTVKPNLHGSFSEQWVIDEVAYREKKKRMLDSFDKNDVHEGIRIQNWKARTFYFANALKNIGFQNKDLVRIAYMTETQVSDLLQGKNGVTEAVNMMMARQNVGIGGFNGGAYGQISSNGLDHVKDDTVLAVPTPNKDQTDHNQPVETAKRSSFELKTAKRPSFDLGSSKWPQNTRDFAPANTGFSGPKIRDEKSKNDLSYERSR